MREGMTVQARAVGRVDLTSTGSPAPSPAPAFKSRTCCMNPKCCRLALALAASLAALSQTALSPVAAQVASEAPPPIDASQTVRGVVAKYLEFRGPAYLQLQTI